MIDLQRSSDLLQSATATIQTHEAALERMKSKVDVIHSSNAQNAAASAALLVKQVQSRLSMLTLTKIFSHILAPRCIYLPCCLVAAALHASYLQSICHSACRSRSLHH